MSSNKFQHYLPEEDEQIIQMVKEGYAPWVIAETLGRDECALYYRRRSLGVPPGPWPKSKKYQRVKAYKQRSNINL